MCMTALFSYQNLLKKNTAALVALTVQVPLFKPRKKRESKKNDKDWEILTEPTETD